MLDKWTTPPERIGESLAPAARRLLMRMELWDDFLRDGHAPSYLKQSAWGGPELTTMDSLHNLDGPGFCLDRARFELFLRNAATARGVTLLAPARLIEANSSARGFRLKVRLPDREVIVAAPVVVDAAGRTSRWLSAQQGERTLSDSLVCLFIYGQEQGAAPATAYTESEPDGFWYTTRLPSRRRVLAFHTDHDLTVAKDLRSADALLKRASASATLSAALADAAFDEHTQVQVCAAHSSVLTFAAKMVGPEAAWLAVGDAAMSFDPLSSQGLFHALFTGFAAARAITGFRAGDNAAIDAYHRSLVPVWTSYCAHLTSVYAQERRWSNRPFWSRRHGAITR